MEQVLLKRFAILVDGEESQLANVIERSVDIASLVVIGSSAYQKAIRFLFVGWYVQDDTDSSRFVQYKDKINTSYWVHLDPDRMRVPQYQNALHITFSIIYLALFTGAINTVNPSGDLDAVEGLLYIFTLGFIADELSKFYKVGRFYISFWNGPSIVPPSILSGGRLTCFHSFQSNSLHAIVCVFRHAHDSLKPRPRHRRQRTLQYAFLQFPRLHRTHVLDATYALL